MLFPKRYWAGMADGTVTLAFRRWPTPRVRVGGRQITPAGVVAFDAVERVEPADIGDADARRAGYATVDELRHELAGYGDHPVYRIEFQLDGADPRVALREKADLSDAEWADITGRLARLDRASPHGPWTTTVLRLLDEHPATRAVDLATSIGRDRASFKLDVRKLKAMGLTESLNVGYRLSPRGRAALDRLG